MRAPVTALLFVAALVAYVLTGHSTQQLIDHGAAWQPLIVAEPWRLVTAIFLHKTLAHVVLNSIWGVTWAMPLERRFGRWRLLLLFLASGVGGFLISTSFQGNPTVGTSGAVFGLTGATLVSFRLWLGSWRLFWEIRPIRITVFITAAWLLLGPLVGFDSLAHIGGFLVGAALVPLLERS